MRKLVRPKVSLPTLSKIKKDHPLGKDGSAEFPDGKWNNPDVRGVLYAMHGRICAYCGSAASDQRGDVEHYRPKSIYPWLTYEFMNYLLGCRVCNSARKSNEFPISSGASRLTFKTQMAKSAEFLQESLASESRLLIDPVTDSVEEWLDINPKPPARVCPSEKVTDIRIIEMVEKSIDFFGLNTIPELIEGREVQVSAVLIALNKWRNGENSRAEDVRALANRYAPHGWAVRKVASVLAPDLPLSTAEEDLKWLVDKTLELLDIADGILTRNISAKDRALVKNRREESCWTLAALWKDPPSESPDIVGRWIASRGRSEDVRPFLERL